MARALPMPAPTWPLPSPTTTRVLQDIVRPPLCVFWTLLVRTTRSSRFSVSALIIRAIFSSELQAALAGRVRERLDAPVIQVAAAVEDDPADAGGLGPL